MVSFTIQTRGRRLLKLGAQGLAVVALVATGGCSSMKIEPWVSPFERNNLADPIMSFSRSQASASYLHHVYQSREGARGAEGGSGGGCGCN